MANRTPDAFERLLPGDPAVYRDDATSIFGLWPDFRLAWVNRGYLEFAAANDGGDVPARWAAGAPLWEAVGEPLTDFYLPHFERLLREGRAWSHTYECSSPTTYRRNRMTVSPVKDRQGLLVVNAVVAEAPHDVAERPPREPSPVYVGAGGLVKMCANCRRAIRTDGGGWDWVPAYVRRIPLNVSHGLCPLCAQWLYGDLLKAQAAAPRVLETPR